MWFIYFVLIGNYIKSFQGEMKKILFLISMLAILNGCAQSTSLLGPTYTMAKSGSILQAGNSFAASYGIKKLTGTTPGEYVMSVARSYKDEPILLTAKERECQTFHSSTLSEIFFDTLDGIDCLRDPFSILK
tara:strand:+ start:217 stop:612 length:396 start_codon:yes stop_codon:yes gene_type:complete